MLEELPAALDFLLELLDTAILFHHYHTYIDIVMSLLQ
jgi:hypothetical protein